MKNRNYLVITTSSNKEEVQKLAETMVQKRLAACAQVEGPITSTYWWKGKVEKDEEWKCSFKTSEALYPELERLLKHEHSYDVPEIIAIPIVEGNNDYLSWLAKELKS